MFYDLKGIIYHGELHFTARIILAGNIAWAYDSRQNMGIPFCRCTPTNHAEELTTLENRHAYIYVY
jgi:hypothetical protein